MTCEFCDNHATSAQPLFVARDCPPTDGGELAPYQDESIHAYTLHLCTYHAARFAPHFPMKREARNKVVCKPSAVRAAMGR